MRRTGGRVGGSRSLNVEVFGSDEDGQNQG